MKTVSLSGRCCMFGVGVALALGGLGLALGFGPDTEDATTPGPFTAQYPLHELELTPSGANRYFSLEPGHHLVLAGEDDGEEVLVEITVLDETRTITFLYGDEEIEVTTRVVEEVEWIDGELVEVSRNYFARAVETNDIYYFGEDVDIYKNGKIVSHEGAWLAGVDGALPGMIMPGTYLLGSRYFQEIAEEVALDRAINTAMGLTVRTKAGTFHDCVQMFETTPLDPESQSIKVYAPGIGLIVDDVVELIEFD